MPGPGKVLWPLAPERNHQACTAVCTGNAFASAGVTEEVGPDYLTTSQLDSSLDSLFRQILEHGFRWAQATVRARVAHAAKRFCVVALALLPRRPETVR